MNDKRKRNKSKLSAIMTGNNAGLERAASTPAAEELPVPREKSAVGRLGAALHSLTEQRSETVDPSLIIQNLDAKLLLPSLALDRAFEGDDEELDSLVESISQNGQQVPVLVRPHPGKPDHYQIAYGHRRVKACQRLDIAVRAVVENLSDEELVIAQGKENEERKNLTYIQQCYFAAELSKTFTREVVAAAVGAGDKTRVSKLTSIIRRVPEDLIESIGSARGIGRVKWETVAKACESEGTVSRLRKSIANLKTSGKWQGLTSPDRFAWLHDLTISSEVVDGNLSPSALERVESRKAAARSTLLIKDSEGKPAIEARGTRNFKIVLADEARAAAFSEYLTSKINQLLKDFEQQEQKVTELMGASE
ncbi:plasmid partitioning protein RepB [Pseudovibrio sp. Tun.PSC04-5.I4]|uniref:plasmid partitioning protein RepB n=1 Tax=Pseudovibrio sp. Tun.PSC04-5.I4 TaxID=1798213 RepID=UPI0008875E39|nr:plasmid partitioning protein RepB [Pseudovibrio sp. Tun.PSC04-5.I4]SDQ31108.1 chromosome partitioning protein, ParB family [Pseudovibrio sp. Tun.PSC04-5.I4]SDQ33972.1 chromosome partitioning protein, ParB family [Pseudovibrio sp. Tun.PSC04-5.I4]